MRKNIHILSMPVFVLPFVVIAQCIVMISPSGNPFDVVRKGILSEVESDCDVHTIIIEKATTVDLLNSNLEKRPKPKVFILLGNKSIVLYKKYVSNHSEYLDIPVIVLLALDVKRAVAPLPNVYAIAYETPMITACVKFRRVTGIQIERVGVIYRKPLEEFVEKNIKYCEKEKIDVKTVLIDSDQKKYFKSIQKALQVMSKENIKVVFITNDSQLLTPHMLVKQWIPWVARNHVAVIVGVEILVKPELQFGTFAVIPDAQALGEQAAGILLDMMDNGWDYNGVVISPPISMYSVLNMRSAKKLVKKKMIKINEVTKIMK